MSDEGTAGETFALRSPKTRWGCGAGEALGEDPPTSWSTSMGSGASLSLAPLHRDWQLHLADREHMAADGSRITRTEPSQGTPFP